MMLSQNFCTQFITVKVLSLSEQLHLWHSPRCCETTLSHHYEWKVQVKFLLCLINHNAIKSYVGMEEKSHAFLNIKLDP